MLINATVSAASPDVTVVSFTTQSLVIGTAYSMDASAEEPFFSYGGGGTIAYSLEGKTPLGLQINTSTGVLTGTLAALQAATVCTVRGNDNIGFNSTASATLGVAVASDARVPESNVFNLWPAHLEAAYGAWDTTATISTSRTALQTEILTKVTDTGTTAKPKIHKITYTGPDDLLGDFSVNGTAADDTVIIYVDMQGAQFDRLDVRNINLCVEDARATSENGFGNYSIGVGAASGCFYKCRLGGRWHSNLDDGMAQTPVNANAAEGISFIGCWFAGGNDGLQLDFGYVYLIGNYFSHQGADPIRGINQPSPSNRIFHGYFCGNVIWWTCTGGSSTSHGDGWQDSSQADLRLYWFENIIVVNQQQYGGTGFRSQNERAEPGDVKDLRFKKNIIGGTGVALLEWNTSDPDITTYVEVDQLIGVVGPNAGSRFMITDTPDVETNFIQSGTSAANIETRFPSVVGADEVLLVAFGAGSETVYITDLPQFTHHPQSIRDYYSTSWVPAAGWSAGTDQIEDPAGWGQYVEFVWDKPTYSPPTISALAVTTISATEVSGSISMPAGYASGDGAIIWVAIYKENTTPRWPQLTHGVRLDGGAPEEAAGVAGSNPRYGKPGYSGSTTNASYTGIRFQEADIVGGTLAFTFTTTWCASATNYGVVLGVEAHDGNLSNILQSWPHSF